MFCLGSFHAGLKKVEFGVWFVHLHEEMLSVIRVCSFPGVYPGKEGSWCLLRMCLGCLNSSMQCKAPAARSVITGL